MKKQGSRIRHKSPPAIARLLLQLLADRESTFPLLGDIEEDYQDIYATLGALRANCWYWLQVIISVPAWDPP